MARLALALLLALAGLPVPAEAQQGDTLVLSFDRALAIARRSNPAYRRAVNDLTLNGPDTRATWAREILPSVQLNLSTSYQGNLQRRATDNFGNPIANPGAAYTYFSSTRQGLSLGWQLQGASVRARKQDLDARRKGRRVAEEVAFEILRIELGRRFFDALEQEALLRAQRAAGDASRSDREVVEERFRLALATRVDVRQAELRTERRELAERQQAGRRDRAFLALRTMLGDSGLPPVRPEPTEPPILDPASLDGEALVRRAIASGPAVRREEAVLAEQEVQVQLSHGLYWPMLSMQWQFARHVQGPRSGSLFSLGGFGGNALSSGFSVTMSAPFLNDVAGGRLLMARAEVQRDNQREALREARFDAERATRTALIALRDRWDGLAIARRWLAVAREAVELAREEYRLGIRTFEQLQLAVDEQADAREQAIAARYGFVGALFDLEDAVGGPVR